MGIIIRVDGNSAVKPFLAVIIAERRGQTQALSSKKPILLCSTFSIFEKSLFTFRSSILYDCIHVAMFAVESVRWHDQGDPGEIALSTQPQPIH